MSRIAALKYFLVDKLLSQIFLKNPGFSFRVEHLMFVHIFDVNDSESRHKRVTGCRPINSVLFNYIEEIFC
ncbi:hypothetical protein N825_09085 [Skermanella stibiiresistens SB22]|uniref:Uncharacterized protein n=1 Tax=Skermanella stibiiresistens SB22 TaxID=1385369 RepID=W9GV05_9PROT|nr:hypothetical protein N825_09085 [Skermanella stibiiresistens SB22]